MKTDKNEIAIQIRLNCSYAEARERVTQALQDEGFGVLTEIDVKATLKEKMDADFREYTILGACNPPLAQKALMAEPLIGLMLPCNVTIEATETGSMVSLVNPQAMLLANPLLAKNPALKEVAKDAYLRFSRAAKALSES